MNVALSKECIQSPNGTEALHSKFQVRERRHPRPLARRLRRCGTHAVPTTIAPPATNEFGQSPGKRKTKDIRPNRINFNPKPWFAPAKNSVSVAELVAKYEALTTRQALQVFVKEATEQLETTRK